MTKTDEIIIQEFRKKFVEELNAPDEKWIPVKMSVSVIKDNISVVELEQFILYVIHQNTVNVRRETLEEVDTEQIMEKTAKALADEFKIYNYDAMTGALIFKTILEDLLQEKDK